MKKRLIALFAIIAVFGLAIAAVAYAQTTGGDSARSSCCTKDSCPMKKKNASDTKTDSCCDNCDCCKDGKCTGDSCPMKKKGTASQVTKVNVANDKMAATADGCCCSCCGDSCPMKKNGETKATTVTATDGKDCGCCCKAKKDTAV